jgi:dolichyl-phosphate-mannose--protein O-mannosyl transferase
MSEGEGNERAGLFSRIANWPLLVIVGTFCSIFGAVTYIYEKYAIKDPAVTWAITVVIVLFIFCMLFNYCCVTQAVLHDEINRQAKAKKILEDALLNNRQSSNGAKKRRNKGRGKR